MNALPRSQDSALNETAAIALPAPEHRPHLRLLTCGSVDDGKSTLIGRLLFETDSVPDDQLANLELLSRRHGTRGEQVDYALLLDGLSAEREQGITIDVAWRYFGTTRTAFIVADSPGHAEYTRNMVTAASHCDLAVLLVDARQGLLPQTLRHACIAALLGIERVVLAVNKMDRIGFDAEAFERIVERFADFAARVGLEHVQPIPLCAIDGDNLVQRSARMPWYAGPALLEHLEAMAAELASAPPRPRHAPRLPVSWVVRPDADFRGFAGQLQAGALRVGDSLRSVPSGQTSKVRGLWLGEQTLDVAHPGQSIVLALEDEIDSSRGDVLCAASDPVEASDQFEVDIVWLGEQPMLPGRPYRLQLGTASALATPATPKYRLNVETLEHLAARTLAVNEIGRVNLALDRALPFEAYADNPGLGGGILIDTLSHQTVGAVMVRHALRRASNLHWQALDINRAKRAGQKGQKPAVLWFTGLSGAGKSTIANLVEKQLHALGKHTYLLDGDNVRHGLNKDLGFTDADRVENIRRVAEVARLMADAGLICLVSFISPFRSERDFARGLLPPGEFFEVFVDTPLEVAEARDVKGLYAKARRGELRNFTGIDSAYERPQSPELHLQADQLSPEAAAEAVIEGLRRAGVLEGEL
ncbi:adenylyl-sulfate kinase [Aquimonas voraii]|uniref:Adenylyl-sulfate kinase n=1 Tax=Aquimonas voraii TaxID=265719 RepID=A0A1G6SV33_9GAMM|nr:adenylyl-sulfate kinase [Aquimonas voraii]SDD20702.1 adenylylsulfate kinase /sulfate adenylyltransferase subunit 1 [Aquimonas voraii]